MNRKQEYDALMKELEQTPMDLNYTVTRVRARADRNRRGRTRRLFGIPLASVGGLLMAFVLLVNFSLPVALACVNVPALKELMAAVAFSDSLKAMVQNDFVQPVEMTQCADGVEMTIHYLVYDGMEMNIFYTASRQDGGPIRLITEYADGDGEELGPMSWSDGNTVEAGELNQLSMGIHSRESFPETLRLTAKVYPAYGYTEKDGVITAAPATAYNEWDRTEDPLRKQEPLATLTFELKLDDRFIKARRVEELNTEIDLDGRILIVERMTVYPTGTRLVIREKEDNDAELSGLTMWLENSGGERTDQGSSGGIISSGGAEEGTMNYFFESVYFDEREELTLCVSQGRWLEKDKKTVTLDLVHLENSTLPEGLSLIEVERSGDDARLTFLNELYGGNFLSGWYDETGEIQYFDSWATSMQNQEDPDQPPYREWTYLWDYTGDTVDVKMNWSQIVDYAQPVRTVLG